MSASFQSGTVLDRIALKVRERLEEDRARATVQELLENARKPHDFRKAFLATGPNIIAEVKKASPSEGTIASDADPSEVAKQYLSHGAKAISVLTERDYFGGSPDYLRRVRKENAEALLLMKDFVVDEYQLAQAAHLGADAALLIVSLLGRERSATLLARAGELGLTALVEVHDEDEMAIALDIGAKLIGVNNRNLKTLEVSLETSVRILEKFKGVKSRSDVTLISESGIKTASDLRMLRELGYDGFLIGTHLMRSGHPGQALQRLIEEAR
jgi:indole-3-glycerol phosphate synthase